MRVMGRPLGMPKTGIFGLLDLVGLDLHAACRCAAGGARCRKTIPIRRCAGDWPLITKMIAEGYTGRKGKGGFYRLSATGGRRG